jgi:DNA-binding transcriptional LysR family regulator
MNLHHLRIFLAVAEHEHITRASEELVLSQPAVTKSIQSLEHELGVELIERQGRRITLTYAGRVLRGHARRIFTLEREAEEAVAALRDVEAGEITLGASATTGVYLLPHVVARFRARYPQVALHISILNSHEVIEETLNWRLDFGVVEGYASALPSDLKVEVLATDELVLVVGPGHRWRGLSALQPEALRDKELVLREKGSGLREVIEHALEHQGVRVNPLLTLPDNEAIKQMVMSGVGTAIVSALAVQHELEIGELISVPIAGLDLHPQLSLIYRTDKQLSRAAQAFCSLLLPVIKDELET